MSLSYFNIICLLFFTLHIKILIQVYLQHLAKTGYPTIHILNAQMAQIHIFLLPHKHFCNVKLMEQLHPQCKVSDL